MEKANKKLQYNALLKLLFEGILPGTGLLDRRPALPADFNRVRRMCKIYGAEIMQDSIEQFAEVLEWQNPPEFKSLSHALNYLQGIAKKNLLASTSVNDNFDVGDIFKDL